MNLTNKQAMFYCSCTFFFEFGVAGQNLNCVSALGILFKFSVVVASVASCQLSVVSVCRFCILLHCLNDFVLCSSRWRFSHWEFFVFGTEGAFFVFVFIQFYCEGILISMSVPFKVEICSVLQCE